MNKPMYIKRRTQAAEHPEHEGAVELSLLLIADLLAEKLWGRIEEDDDE